MSKPQPSLQIEFGKAVAAYNAGKLKEAERHCRGVLSARPNLFDARFLMALVQSGLGEDRQAVESFNRALALKPGMPEVLNGKAAALQRLRRFEEAVASYDAAIATSPKLAEAHYNRATALDAMGRSAEAIEGYGRAIEARPDFVEAFNNRGILLQAAGRSEAALADYQTALSIAPRHIALLHNRGRLLREMGRREEALASYDRALAVAANRAEIWNSRGIVLQDLGRADEAVRSFERALALHPEDPGLMANAAKALLQAARAADALALLDRAGSRSADAAIAALRGNVLYELERFDDAVASYDRALAGEPERAEVRGDRANALRELGRLDEALADYDRAIALDPEADAAVYGRATLLLFMGRYGEGWLPFERRRAMLGWKGRRLDTPVWDGSDLAGRTLLVHAEQGLGDTIQFVRFAPLAAERGGRVVVEVPQSLRALVATLPGIEAVAKGEDAPAHDVSLPLMSLPAVLGIGDRLLGERVPYVAIDPARVATWRERLPGGPLRIGIAWQGNPRAKVDRVRSVPLAAFAPLARLAGVTLVSLQKNDGLDQLENLPEGMRVETLPDDFASGPDSFMDTAAVMANLDLVVSIDSAVSHLAGALGIPLFVALKKVPEWRWMAAGEDTPWYPSARLFRQTTMGDWDELFERIAAAAAEFLKLR